MASLTDIFTAAQNIASAINNAAQAYVNVQGAQNSANISATLQVSAKAGRVCVISILTAGGGVGTVYDTNTTANTTRPVFSIPNTVGVIFVNMPVSYGILIVPGSGQVVTVSYS